MATAKLTGQKIKGQKVLQTCRIDRDKSGAVVRVVCTPAKKKR